MLVDAHCHLDSFRKITIPENIIPVTVGYSHHSNEKNVLLAKQYDVPYVLGIAPQTAVKEGIEKLDEWTAAIKRYSPKAIGEIGLDFHWAKTEEEKERQRKLLTRMLDLAEEMELPVVIHSRDAQREVIEILKKRKLKGIMMHFFSGTVEEAQECLELGAYLSIVALHSKERRRTIEITPLNRLLTETDAPYVMREISDVKKAVEYIAEVKGIPYEKVADETYKNAKRFFGF